MLTLYPRASPLRVVASSRCQADGSTFGASGMHVELGCEPQLQAALAAWSTTTLQALVATYVSASMVLTKLCCRRGCP